MMSQSVDANGGKHESCLVFRVYGGRYFLSEMWIGGSVSGRQFPISHLEKELAKNETSHEVILLAKH